MRLSRRTMIASSAAVTALAPLHPVIGAPVRPLRIASPGLLYSSPDSGVMSVTSHELYKALAPHLARPLDLEAVVDEADAQLLWELLRFEAGLRWNAVPIPAESQTFAGRLCRDAQLVTAAKR